VFAVGLLSWAALALATMALSEPPITTVVPLLALASVFEAVHALHIATERIGRYLSVFHEDSWERTLALFGQPSQGIPHPISPDPLFSIPFLLAAIVNLEPLLPAGPTAPELTFVVGAHALFVLRVLSARATARRQRAVDAARFEELKRRA
jgi:hypothetical protein